MEATRVYARYESPRAWVECAWRNRRVLHEQGISNSVIKKAYELGKQLTDTYQTVWAEISISQESDSKPLGFSAQRLKDGGFQAAFLTCIITGNTGAVYREVSASGTPATTVIKIPSSQILQTKPAIDLFSRINVRDCLVRDLIVPEALRRGAVMPAAITQVKVRTRSDATEVCDVAALRMPLAEAGDGFDFIDRPEFASVSYLDRLQVALDAARQLATAAHKGVVLRDRKPENVLVFKQDGRLRGVQADLGESLLAGEVFDEDLGKHSRQFTVLADWQVRSHADLQATAVTQQAVTTIEFLIGNSDMIPKNKFDYLCGSDRADRSQLRKALRAHGIGKRLARALAQATAHERVDRPTAEMLVAAITDERRQLRHQDE